MEVSHLNHHVLSAAKVTKKILTLLAVVFLFWGCANPSGEDKERVRELQRLFGDRYTFKFEDEFYLHAQLKKGAVSSEQDAEEIYKVFKFTDFKKRLERHTSYIYLNMFDPKGVFLFQLHYDTRASIFVRGKTPHY